jgi:tRNA threonylcarbamoyladenosine biosynthesis protein TsaE
LIELDGPLGAGKTTFVRHLLRALGVTGRIKSPTFAVLESYTLPGLEISHFDFYRLGDPREWLDAGFRETLSSPGLKLIEWAAKAGAWLPDADLCIAISTDDDAGEGLDDHRRVQIVAATSRGAALLTDWTDAVAAPDAAEIGGLVAVAAASAKPG